MVSSLDDSNHHHSNLLYTSPNHTMDGENFSRKLLMLWVLSSPPFPLCHHLALRAPSYAYNQYLPQHQKCKVKTRLSYSCGMMGGGGSWVEFWCCLVHLYWTLWFSSFSPCPASQLVGTGDKTLRRLFSIIGHIIFLSSSWTEADGKT